MVDDTPTKSQRRDADKLPTNRRRAGTPPRVQTARDGGGLAPTLEGQRPDEQVPKVESPLATKKSPIRVTLGYGAGEGSGADAWQEARLLYAADESVDLFAMLDNLDDDELEALIGKD